MSRLPAAVLALATLPALAQTPATNALPDPDAAALALADAAAT